MKYSALEIALVTAALVILGYAVGDLVDLWHMEPLVVLILSTVALVVGLRRGRTSG